MLRRWGWQVDAESCESVRSFARDLSGLHSVGILLSQEELDGLAQTMRDAAEIESDRTSAVPVFAEQLDWVVRTIAIELVLLDLRRLAQHDVYTRRLEIGEIN
jgi:hypothetical protein